MRRVNDLSGGPPPGWAPPPEPPRGPQKTVIGEPILLDGVPVFQPVAGAEPTPSGSESAAPEVSAPVDPFVPMAGEAAPAGAPEGGRGPLNTLIDEPLPGGPTDAGAPPYSDVIRSDAAPATPPPAESAPTPAPALASAPSSGSRRVAATVVDADLGAPPPAAEPSAGYAPQGAPAYGGAASPAYGAAPGFGPAPAARPSRNAGPPLVAIGVAAAVFLAGGLTLAFWLKGRSSSSSDEANAAPAIPVPVAATVASDPPADPSSGDLPADPALTVPTVPAATTPPPASKPAATSTATSKPKPSATATSTSTAKPTPTGSTKPKPQLIGKGKKPLILR